MYKRQGSTCSENEPIIKGKDKGFYLNFQEVGILASCSAESLSSSHLVGENIAFENNENGIRNNNSNPDLSKSSQVKGTLLSENRGVSTPCIPSVDQEDQPIITWENLKLRSCHLELTQYRKGLLEEHSRSDHLSVFESEVLVVYSRDCCEDF